MKKKFVTRKKEDEEKKDEVKVVPSNEVVAEERKKESAGRGKYTAVQDEAGQAAAEFVPFEKYLRDLREKIRSDRITFVQPATRSGQDTFSAIVKSLAETKPQKTKTCIGKLEEVLEMRKFTLSDILKQHKTPVRVIQ